MIDIRVNLRIIGGVVNKVVRIIRIVLPELFPADEIKKTGYPSFSRKGILTLMHARYGSARVNHCAPDNSRSDISFLHDVTSFSLRVV